MVFDDHAYAGENKVLFPIGRQGNFGIYDIAKNTLVTLDYDDSHAEWDEGLYFYDGFAAFTFVSGMRTGIETISADGTVTEPELSGGTFTGSHYVNGTDKFAPITGELFFNYSSRNGYWLWNRDGQLVKDLTNLNIVFGYTGTGTFVNGYYPVVIQNSEGSNYVALLNEEGEFSFEPQKVDEFYHLEAFDGNYLVVAYNGESYNSIGYLIFDLDGNVTRCENYAVTGVSNGILELNSGELYLPVDSDQIS